jgi:hypothetical protein
MIHLVYFSQYPRPSWMDQAWVDQIERYHTGGLKVSVIGPDLGTDITNLLHGIASSYRSVAPVFLIFDDNLKIPAQAITPTSLQQLSLPSTKNLVESTVGSFFT